MVKLSKIRMALVALVISATGAWLLAGDEGTVQQRRDKYTKLAQQGNFKEAYEGLRKLALDPRDDRLKVGSDMDLAVNCLQRLGRVDEIDDFREAVIKVHEKNWRLLASAAWSYARIDHHGFIVAGKFARGNRRGGGQYVDTRHRDRVRALQLMDQALALTKNENDKTALAQFHLDYAHMLVQGAGYHEPWRLQYLTDLTKLPDYEEGYRFYGGQQGAPVDAEGNPIFHHLPKSYETSKSDGERWRWLLAMATEYEPGRLNEVEFEFANFLKQQFGVETMAQYGFGRRGGSTPELPKTGTFALHTLGDDETIARLASGVKRFKLPDEFNWIKIALRIAGRGHTHQGEQALLNLAQDYENRRQYVKAAAVWRRAIKDYGAADFRQQRLDQIVSNWGRFESSQTQPAGAAASVDFRFRNGTKVKFEAFTIDVPRLLNDVKAYLAANPGQVDWNRVYLGNIGHRIIEGNQQHYVGAKVAAWDVALKPRENHVDDRITVTTPLKKPGAYLLVGKMQGGNTSRVIVWVSDTIILKKQLDGQVLYYVADAMTGQPVAKANVEFFGWKQIQVQPNRNQFQVLTTSFAEATNADGQITVGPRNHPDQYQWLITAKKAKAGPAGGHRFAYLGFTGIWFGRQYDPEYNQTKVLTITDRPVYRPDQPVHFKFWVRHAKYDEPDISTFAGKTFTIQINNPKGEKVFERTVTADEYGGLSGEYLVPRDATLGNYHLHVVNHGGSSFRVEEYKKPEFEVIVEAPKEPVRLGEEITATIRAKYYFGAPVTKAKVKYKVMRTTHSTTWYPVGDWDWCFGPGYWWFSPDFPWYPGWRMWGCARPIPPWWRFRHEPPEIVLENEVPIEPDGTVKVIIDTLPAKELHGDEDHKYTITAEVLDESRRTIVGTGEILVTRKPFQVYAWIDRGHYRTGDTIGASFRAQTPDRKAVQGRGDLTLYQISYSDKNEPVETAVQTWRLDTNEEGYARQQMKAVKPGQYRLSYKVTDKKDHTIEGGYLFLVRGEGFDTQDARFNDIELLTDKREYKPGEKVSLLVNANRKDGTVLLFVRPTNGVYLPPKTIRLPGKSVLEHVDVVQRDMPNFFVEAVTISGGRIHSEVREVIVPPEKRILNVDVQPSQEEYKPGQKASVKIRLTEMNGKPFVGSTAVSIYDKSVEYISGGTNVPEIKEYFWKWRRHHHPQTESSIQHWLGNLLRKGEMPMSNLGIFGATVVEEMTVAQNGQKGEREQLRQDAFNFNQPPMSGLGGPGGFAPGAPMAGAAGPMDRRAADGAFFGEAKKSEPQARPEPDVPLVQPTVRKHFADTAFWAPSLTTDKHGIAEVFVTMPENLTAWKIRVWAMGHGTKVGQGDVVVTTKKDLLVRLQAPRFFVEKDEVVLSANVHNYLKKEKTVHVALELEGGTLSPMTELKHKVTIASNGEKRIDWRVKVTGEGEAVVRVKALSDEDSDAMEMRFPCFVHGMLKMESYTGVIRPSQDSGKVVLNVPAERRINDTRLEVRYSPSLAAAMVDALPFMVDYPYGCTEQTLNRFVPTVITQRILLDMKLDLKAIQKQRTNLNAQEIGDDKERIKKGWKRFDRNPVFDEEEVKTMAKAGVQALSGMQCTDGGWGWFSGFGERSFPHTTAVVVHGLQLAKQNGVVLPGGMLERGVEWLKIYQADQVQRLLNFPTKTKPYKEHADNIDALVYMVLVDAGILNADMLEFLYRDRNHLSVYGKAIYGIALHKQQQAEKLAMILRNIEQYVVQDDENQTAYLRLPADNHWWTWYGSEIEAHAWYLKLLALTNPKDERAPRLVKYLLNNRKHATYWNSTRDTAFCLEAFADYLKASGEDRPDMTVEVWLDGRKHKEVRITTENLFTYDNKLVLLGDAVDTGKHTLELKRKGTGPVYWNAYLSNFTLEDFITRAGLEVKVNRKYYKLTRVDHKIKAPGARGQVLEQKVEKYERSELANLAALKSGDLVEIELEIDSKNDYEYLIFEDPKAAGFEPMLVRSGYVPNSMGAYMELRDEKVCFFVRTLARGKHSLSYRMRAEIPGRFSALPTSAYAMYAPELRGNSDEIKLIIED